MEAEDFGAEINLNVYSVGRWNCVLNFLGIGIFHTGVQIYDTEYWYGGHDLNSSGVVRSRPGELELRLEERVLVGYTAMSRDEVGKEVEFLDGLWLGSEYEPFSHNCNDFAKELIWRIGKSDYFPKYINRFAQMKPFLKMWYAPLKLLVGDLVKVRGDASSTLHIRRAEGLYRTHAIRNEPDFLSVKEEADSYYMVNAYENALVGFAHCVEAREHCSEDYVLQHVFIAAANCSFKLGRYEEMADYATLCINTYTGFVAGYVKRAAARRMLKDYDESYADLRRAHELAPEDLLIQEELKRFSKSALIKIGP